VNVHGVELDVFRHESRNEREIVIVALLPAVLDLVATFADSCLQILVAHILDEIVVGALVNKTHRHFLGS